MACEYMYRVNRTEEDVINDRRDEALATLEQELAAGMARIVEDPYTGKITIEDASVMPEGMADICVLEAMQSRNSLEFQLAVGNAGLQDRDFVAMHRNSHS